MSARAKTFVAVAAIAALVVAFRGTAQAIPTVYTVPNYNFQDSVDAGWLADGQHANYPDDTWDDWDADKWFAASGDQYPYYAGEWNPTSASFTTAGGNGVLPGTAAGSQCLTNAATSSADVMYIAGTLTGYHQVTPITHLQANKRYTMTMAIGSAKNATIMDGNSLFLVDTTALGLIAQHDDMMPNGLKTGYTPGPGVFSGSGTFGDISFSIASNDIIGNQGGMPVNVGDGLTVGMAVGAGTCWSNVRVISQNWYPLYSAGSFTWDTAHNAAWSSTSGGAYSATWTAGQDAVFEGNGGTVTVSGSVSANSLSFFNSGVNNQGNANASTGSYTISGPGTITLTGDAIITTGAGTNNNAGANGGNYDPTLGNPGGGTNTIACVLQGTNGMYKAGGGTLILTGANQYTGGTVVGGGTLQIGGGDGTGSIVGDVTNLANLAFNRSDTFTFAGTISGTGSVDVLGTGRTVFTANHSYAGITTIHAGTLQLGNGGTTGSIVGDVVNNATLAFNHSNAVTYGGKISGTGGVTQMGAGHVTLTGANQYSGLTRVQQGALEIANSTAVTSLLGAGANITGGELLLDYSSGSDPAASVLADLRSGLIYDSAITIHSGVGAMTLGWLDNTTTDQITIMPTLVGDANLDGVVTNADLNIVQQNLNHIGMTWSQGDFNYDGMVNYADLAGLYANLNQTPPVPEPSTLVLLGIGAISLLAYAWRRRTA